MSDRRRYFKQVQIRDTELWRLVRNQPPDLSLSEFQQVLEYHHIKAGLLNAYDSHYPLVEPRELIPSFDAPHIEHHGLPAFGVLILDREISYQDEVFQFDLLTPEGSPPDPSIVASNRLILRERLPRDLVPVMDRRLGRRAVTALNRYIWLLPFLTRMDRGHVIARDQKGGFHLSGIFASFPSDLDGEIKRFGLRIGKFKKGDNKLYEANRKFVYNFIMEQCGFPICGERHTSAAIFARRMLRKRERFIIKVLGTSDRTITTMASLGSKGGRPALEKVALVSARNVPPETIEALYDGGYFVDEKRNVVILRVVYGHHRYHSDNVLEDRALSVRVQQIIHPETGGIMTTDVLGLAQDRMLLLNDIVRGEHEGTILYRGRYPVSGTYEHKNRLKFLSAWLGKHRAILADYSPDNFETTSRIISSYLQDPKNSEISTIHPKLFEEVKEAAANLRVSHRLRLLEKMVNTRSDHSGRRLQHSHILIILVHILGTEGDTFARRHPRALGKLLNICRRELSNKYLKRKYLAKEPVSLKEREVLGEYRLLERLVERMEGKMRNPASEENPPA